MAYEYKVEVVSKDTYHKHMVGSAYGPSAEWDVIDKVPATAVRSGGLTHSLTEPLLVLGREVEEVIDWEAAYRALRKATKIVQLTGEIGQDQFAQNLGKRELIIQEGANQMIHQVLKSVAEHGLVDARWAEVGSNVKLDCTLFIINRDDWDALPVPAVLEGASDGQEVQG